ncbi:MAG: isochorismatase family protein, partial [Bryobacteraceae bacterium]
PMPTPSLLARAADSVLVIVDIQDRLLAVMPAGAREAMLHNTRILAQSAALLAIPVLVTEQYPNGLGHTAAPVAEALPAATPRVEKTCFSCAASAAFTAALAASGRSQIILAGMEAHVCVLQSALDLRAAGREVWVAEDACCSRNPANHRNAIGRMRAAGVVVANTESVVFEWLRDAGHEHFKAISALVR